MCLLMLVAALYTELQRSRQQPTRKFTYAHINLLLLVPAGRCATRWHSKQACQPCTAAGQVGEAAGLQAAGYLCSRRRPAAAGSGLHGGSAGDSTQKLCSAPMCVSVDVQRC